MATKRPAERYRDIATACDAIFAYTKDYDEARYFADQKTQDAVERQLLKIAEAAAKLGETAPRDLPQHAWPAIRGLGNRLRHEYDSIDGDTIWNLISTDTVKRLRDDCKKLHESASG